MVAQSDSEKQEIIKETQSLSYEHCSAATELENQVTVIVRYELRERWCESLQFYDLLTQIFTYRDFYI